MTEGLYFLPEKQFAQLIHLPFDVQLLSFWGKNGTTSVKVSLVHVLNLTSDCIRSVNFFFLKLRVWTPCQGYISVIDRGKLLRVWKSEFSMCFFL